MELFSVKRYDENKKTNDVQVDEILKNLQEKIENRKRKKALIEKCSNEEDDVLEQHSRVKQSPGELVENDIGIDETPINNDNEAKSCHAADTDDFKVLGEVSNVKTKNVMQLQLPSWLRYPTIISTDINSITNVDDGDVDVDKLSDILADHIMLSLKELKVTRLFPVQDVVIPWILKAHSYPSPFRPRDVCISAPTGSGKTLAFAIPIVQLLASRVKRNIGALVVVPVAELALQVYKIFEKLCKHTVLSVCLLSKHTTIPAEQEKLVMFYDNTYHSLVDIVITTPSRLITHLHETKGFSLKSLKFFVMDEADRFMDATYNNWLYHFHNHVSDRDMLSYSVPLCLKELQETFHMKPHKILVSATLSQDPEKLQHFHLFQPKLFTSVMVQLDELSMKSQFAQMSGDNCKKIGNDLAGQYITPAELTEKYCITESHWKPLTLYALITENSWTKFLCFTNSTQSSSRLAFVLQDLLGKDIIVSELPGSKGKDRANMLLRFGRGKIQGLICADTLARGIDIPDVDIVVSYDAPRHIKSYIHRIGRTARAGHKGTAITLVTQKEHEKFTQMLLDVGKVVTEEIKICGNTEENNAKRFALALKRLRANVEKEKRFKWIRHLRSNEKMPVPITNRKMTLMEKLQAQTNNLILKKQKDREENTAVSRL